MPINVLVDNQFQIILYLGFNIVKPLSATARGFVGTSSPDKAIDNDVNTIYHWLYTKPGPHWFQLDLGSTKVTYNIYLLTIR